MGVIAQHPISTFVSPVNQTNPIDANTVRGNDNTVKTAYNAHDADTTIHLQNGLVASRPAASVLGQMWLATDTGAVYAYLDTGSAWVEVNYMRNTGGTITGNVVITGTLGVTGVATFTAAPVFSSGTASQSMELDASKNLTTVAITGTGNYVKSASPTLTGTAGFASATFSGTINVTGAATAASLVLSGSISGATTASFKTAGMSNAIRFDQLTSYATYGVLSFNNVVTANGVIGFYADAVTTNDLYYNVPTGGKHLFYINSAEVGRFTSTALTVPSLVLSGSITGATTGAFSGAVSMAGLTATTGAFAGIVSIGSALITQDAGGNNSKAAQKLSATLSVSTATTIATLNEAGTEVGAIAIVTGLVIGDNNKRFSDVVAYSYSSGTVTVIATMNGPSPAARTYSKSVSSGALQLAMASGTYKVNVVHLEGSGPG